MLPETTVGSGRSLSPMVWPALLVVYVVWGSTYLGISVLVESVPPILSAGIRFLAAGLIVAAFLVATRGRSVLRLTARELAMSALLGVLLIVICNGALSVAEQHVESGLAALIFAAMALWIAILRRVAGDHPSRSTWLGVGVGLVGLVILLRPGQEGSTGGIGWLLLIALASFVWALGSFLQPRLPVPRDPLVLTAAQLVCGGLMLLVLGWLLGERLDLSTVTTSSLVALAYLIVVGSLVGYVAFVWLVENAPLSLVSTYAYVNPAVAVLLGVLLAGEHLTPTMVVGGAIIVAGVVLIVSGERLARRRS